MRAAPVVFHLNGLPGAGKLTVARSMAQLAGASGHRLVVVDNHLSANPILSVLDLSRGGPPAEAWATVYGIREAVVRTIERHSPASWSFVFTNVLTEDGDSDVGAVERLQRLAARRGARYVPVVLECEVDELVRRAASPGRAELHKITDAAAIRTYVGARPLHHPQGSIVFDVTYTPAIEVAAAVLRAGGLA